MSEIPELFSCCWPECDKLGVFLCSICLGARYCGKVCRKMHWRKFHKHDCDNAKENRNNKWKEISSLAIAYLKVFKYASALSDATAVWRKVGELKGHKPPINSLLSRLAAIETVFKLKEHMEMQILDTEAIETSEESARYLFTSCLTTLDAILCLSSHEQLSFVERLVQLLQQSFDFIETLQRYNFAPLADSSEIIYEYSYLRIRLLQTRGIMLSLQGQPENAVQPLSEAAVICTTKSVRRNEIWRHHSQVLLNLGGVFKQLERFPEALAALEEAYGLYCERTGPADEDLQVIAIEIAEILRETGDFEQAEYFSRVTYEMAKKHHSAADSAGSRCRILTEAVRDKSDIFSGICEHNILQEAEALAREALAGAEAGKQETDLDEALTRLLNVFIEGEQLSSREVYLISLRLLRIRQSVTPQTMSSRISLADSYSVFASVLRAKFLHRTRTRTGCHGRRIINEDVARVVEEQEKFIGGAETAVKNRHTTDPEKGDVATDREKNDEGEWISLINIKMRLFYCLLRAITIYAVEGKPHDELSLVLVQLVSSTAVIVNDLILSGQLDLSGDAVEWKGTTWEAFIEECKHKMDYADQPDVVVGKGDDDINITIVAGEGSVKSEIVLDSCLVDNEKTTEMASAVGRRGSNEYSTNPSATTAVPMTTVVGLVGEEHKVQLGFAYWALGNSLWRISKSDVKATDEEEILTDPAAVLATVNDGESRCNEEVMPRTEEGVKSDDDEDTPAENKKPTMKIDCITVLEEAERVLKLASSYFEGKTLFIASETAEGLLKELADRLEEVSKERTYLEGLLD